MSVWLAWLRVTVNWPWSGPVSEATASLAAIDTVAESSSAMFTVAVADPLNAVAGLLLAACDDGGTDDAAATTVSDTAATAGSRRYENWRPWVSPTMVIGSASSMRSSRTTPAASPAAASVAAT